MMHSVCNGNQAQNNHHLIQSPTGHHQTVSKARSIVEQNLKLLIERHFGYDFVFHIQLLHKDCQTRNHHQSVHTLAGHTLPLYLINMKWLFDICDRARLGERFFGATHTVLARL